MTVEEQRHAFRRLHEAGTFVMPNPHDVGTARLLGALGFPALATTSGGFAASLGRLDMTITRDELVDHAFAICSATALPVNIDAEQCYPDDDGGVSETVRLLGAAGASGCSIEDWNPALGAIEDVRVATERVRDAATVADALGIVLTARAENHLRGHDNLDDTIARLCAFRDAGAHCVYAPALVDLGAIERVVRETGTAVNVLLMPNGPTVAELTSIGVRRISIGGGLARVAYGAFVRAAEYLLTAGTYEVSAPFLDRSIASAAFGR